MPWAPEQFSAPALQRILDRRRRASLRSVPFFDGLLTGEVDALLASFAGVPEVHHPVRGRIRGERAFRRFVTEMTAWFAAHRAEVEDVNVILTGARGIEEVVLHLDSDRGERIGLPLALAADHDDRDRIREIRLYFSSWPLTGRHSDRPPVLQLDSDLDPPDVVRDYRRGDLAVEHCTITDDGHSCALEYNVLGAAGTELSPQAGLAVFVRDERERLTPARAYDDADLAPGRPG